jgi:hypothetical protein
MRGSMVDGRQRHKVRGLNIKCGPSVGSLCHTEAQRITDASGNDQGRVGGEGEGKDPRGGDTGLNRLGTPVPFPAQNKSAGQHHFPFMSQLHLPLNVRLDVLADRQQHLHKRSGLLPPRLRRTEQF